MRRVCSETGLGREEALQVVDGVLQAIKDALVEGHRIELRGFGVFAVRDRKPGVGRNPKTGEEAPIPSGRTVRFKPGKSLREL